jgi:hypothetical protein
VRLTSDHDALDVANKVCFSTSGECLLIALVRLASSRKNTSFGAFVSHHVLLSHVTTVLVRWK